MVVEIMDMKDYTLMVKSLKPCKIIDGIAKQLQVIL